MQNKIPFRFKLDNKKRIGFSTESLDESLLEKLGLYLQDGIAISDSFYDDLFNDTVSNGHNLLKCNGIFTLDTSVVESMSVVIGKFLFRLLFTSTAAFRDCLHTAKQTGSKIEIKLEFDLANPDSKELAQLPWELMYCPDSKTDSSTNEDDAEMLPGGFFLSREAVIYREYKKYPVVAASGPRRLMVAVAFLTRDTDNLYSFYAEKKLAAAAIEKSNPNIQFLFINPVDDKQQTIELLSKPDLSKVFLQDDYQNTDKIIHLVCDADSTPAKSGDARALYFKKHNTETEKIAFAEIYRYLTDYNILPNPDLKLLVLQAWKDNNKYDYAGFEEFATKVIRMNKDNPVSVLSMPYVLKEAGSKKEMNPVFFTSFYSALAKSNTITDAVRLVRNNVVPKYSYGFPLFYFSGTDAVLAGNAPLLTQTAMQPPAPSLFRGAGIESSYAENVKRMLRHLDFDKLTILENEFIKLKNDNAGSEYNSKIDQRIEAVQQLKKEK